MTLEKAQEIFEYWFHRDGHWMFGVNGKEKAMAAWKTCGIDGLPDYVWSKQKALHNR